jgi:hypothetical protein
MKATIKGLMVNSFREKITFKKTGVILEVTFIGVNTCCCWEELFHFKEITYSSRYAPHATSSQEDRERETRTEFHVFFGVV